MLNLSGNPFAVQTPEGISASDVLSLFVEDFSNFHQIVRLGHTFLNGARGSGKSMIFRYLEPDCQCLKREASVSELEFLALYIPIKETELNVTEFTRLEREHGGVLINEHILTLSVAIKAFHSLLRVPESDKTKTATDSLIHYANGKLLLLLQNGGWQADAMVKNSSTFDSVVLEIIEQLQSVYSDVRKYLQLRAFGGEMTYSGALLGYLDFLRPALLGFRTLSFLKSDIPIFLLIDDADNLSRLQTQILNAWVSSRGSSDLSLKVSTQRRYKTFRTVNGQLIEAPHDYAEVNISDIYTSDRDQYTDRVKKIVSKRLSLAGINVTPEEFFPVDRKQEEEIEAIAIAIREKSLQSDRIANARHDAYRYSRPDYIRQLGGASKSRSTYSYAGFQQLAHISSGVIRYFLEPAALMFGEQKSSFPGQPVQQISASIQNKVIRQVANDFYMAELASFVDEGADPPHTEQITLLKNLVDSLGALFHSILVSDRSERRVFSVAFSNGPDDEVKSVFERGVEYGYLHKAAIGRKNGIGRTDLYILSRRLAPVFILDPTSFAGYKFITNEAARMMIFSHRQFVARLNAVGQMDELVDPSQLVLFDEQSNG